MDNCLCKGEFLLDDIYVVGENRPIKIRVSDKDTASFTISDAEYQVLNNNKEVVASGKCETDNNEHTVMFFFQPRTSGQHTIIFKITIPPIVRIIDLIARVRSQGEGELELIKPWQ